MHVLSRRFLHFGAESYIFDRSQIMGYFYFIFVAIFIWNLLFINSNKPFLGKLNRFNQLNIFVCSKISTLNKFVINQFQILCLFLILDEALSIVINSNNDKYFLISLKNYSCFSFLSHNSLMSSF